VVVLVFDIGRLRPGPGLCSIRYALTYMRENLLERMVVLVLEVLVFDIGRLRPGPGLCSIRYALTYMREHLLERIVVLVLVLSI